MMNPGPRNLITDVVGLKVGNARDDKLKSGVTCLTSDQPFTTGVDIRGGAPGTREIALLSPEMTVTSVDALVLSGGSAFGLESAAGVMERLRSKGRGFGVGDARVPIVPAAILFDLRNGGDKNWEANPYPELGRQAFDAADTSFAIGTEGAGTGAATAWVKGGLGSASWVTEHGHTVGALVAVNSYGCPTMGGRPNFWAWQDELGKEYGGQGNATFPQDPLRLTDTKARRQIGSRESTTIAIVATDAELDQAQATRLAVAAHDGMARAIQPSHTPMDGDLVFAVSTGARTLADPINEQIMLGHAAATTLARAISRAVYLATPAPGDLLPCFQDLS